MDAALLTPSRFIKSADFLGKDVTYTITKIQLEKLEGKKGIEKKGIVFFSEEEKAWVLNRTNVECLKGMWGRETDNWIGKRVTLYPEAMKDSFTGEDITGIRLRGSPDLDRDVTITIELPRKKPIQKTMRRTGSAPVGRANTLSDPDTEAAILRNRINGAKSVAALDEMWTEGMGGQIKRLPGDLGATLERDFVERKKTLRAAATGAAPATEPTTPPPA
jgi:hypothetical protein